MNRAMSLAAVVALALPATAHASITIPTMGEGNQGGEVRTWQATLNFLIWQAQANGSTGFPKPWRDFVEHRPLVVDGVFGSLTTQATRAYQRAYHLPATGVVGLRSWKTWIESQLTCCGAGYATLGEGMPLSPYVTWWQISLDRWLARREPSLSQLIPDGIYGPLTTQATTDYQRAVGLDIDGIAGHKTWAKLANAGYAHLP